MSLFADFMQTLYSTLHDVVPIAVVIGFFQLLVIRRPPAHMRRILIGFVYVLIGLSLFLLGLERALFPLGRVMAMQLTDPDFIFRGIEQVAGAVHWAD